MQLRMRHRPHANPNSLPKGGGTTSTSDDALLERIQRSAFDYFIRNANPRNGLVADTTREGSPSSIAVVGFALSAYPVGVERGWMTRAEAVARKIGRASCRERVSLVV